MEKYLWAGVFIMQSPSVSALMFIVSVMHGMQLTQQFYLLFHIVVKSFLIKAVHVHLLYFFVL